MPNKVSVLLKDRLDRVHILQGAEGQRLGTFLIQNYIPRDCIIAKIDGEIIDDNSYFLKAKEKVVLEMVRAYQLTEFCKMLGLWEEVSDESSKLEEQALEIIYSKKVLWFNDNGICHIKHASFDKEAFVIWVENNFVEGILSKELIQENDTICLALSGGRDSLALLYLLGRNRHRLPNFKLVGVTVADSAASFEDVDRATEAVKILGLEDYTILPIEYVNQTMHYKRGFRNAIETALQNGGRGRSIATWHCVMRANVEKFARERNINKLASGYHYEDLMSSVFRTYTLGVLFGESVQRKTWGDFTIVSPLWTITKKELTIYLEQIAPPKHSKQGSPTDYDRGDHNRDINYFMADLLSACYPALGFSFFESLEQLNKNMGYKKPTFFQCRNCGITYDDRFMQGTLIDKHFCEQCLFFQQEGELDK